MTPRPGVPGAAVVALAVGVTLVAASFFLATTFIGDDHLFLAFARLAPNPLVALVRDQHGGEFYRPLPMLVWWLLGRASGAAVWPFAALALVLHAASAALLGALLVAVGRARATATLAAALFFLAPQNLEAAYWYAASTDLFATTFALASLVALVRRRRVASAALALAACLSKESALILPALAYVTLGALPSAEPRPRRIARVLPHVAIALAVFAARTRVLHGWGGTGDASASFVGKLVQLAGGLVHVATGNGVLPEPVAWGVGMATLALGVLSAVRARDAAASGMAFAFTALAVAPLLVAGWLVGARYFYLPAAGLAWAFAETLASTALAARVTVGVVLLALGGLQAAARRPDILSYRTRVAAARRAVGEGVRLGARVFHVAGGIKDVDLAVKEDPALASVADELLVMGDVPASFVVMPPALASRAAFLVAAPPLPPSGAYRFGDARIVGLARRGDDPTLDEVVARFPDIRFIRLRATPGGHIVGRDVTEEVKSAIE
jgi:hypothetical protein